MIRGDVPYRFILFTLMLTILFSKTLVFAQGKPYSHKGVSLDLPESWVPQEIPSDFEKEVVAWLKSEKWEGVSILVIYYTGRRHNYNSVRIAGLKTLGASYPKGQEMIKKPTKMKTDKELSAVWEYWRGAIEASGQTVFLESPMGIIQTRGGWVLMIGYTPTAIGSQLEGDFLKILNSVH